MAIAKNLAGVVVFGDNIPKEAQETFDKLRRIAQASTGSRPRIRVDEDIIVEFSGPSKRNSGMRKTG